MASIVDGQPFGVVGKGIKDGLLQRVSHEGEHRNLSSKIFTLCEDLFDGRANFGPQAAFPQVHDVRHYGRNRIVLLAKNSFGLMSTSYRCSRNEFRTLFWVD